MLYKGNIIDQFGGVPKNTNTIADFFQRARRLPLDKTDHIQAAEMADAPADLDGTDFKILKLNHGSGPVVPDGSRVKVKVNYVGKMASGMTSILDQIYKCGPPIYEFTLGAGEVIKAWDEGIKTLKKGQRAVLKCPPEYAYGAYGLPGVIPPNSTLIYEIEVIDF